jgi:hypothetical protein
VSKAPVAITALVEYEAAVLGRDHESDELALESDDMRPNQEQVSEDQLSRGNEELLSEDSRPQLRPGVNVIELPADYKEIVQRLRQRSPLHDIPSRPVKLAIRRTPPGPAEVRQLSPLSAELLDLCEGRLTVQEIAAELLLRNIEIAGVPAGKLCLAGIEILRQQRLIA